MALALFLATFLGEACPNGYTAGLDSPMIIDMGFGCHMEVEYCVSLPHVLWIGELTLVGDCWGEISDFDVDSLRYFKMAMNQ